MGTAARRVITPLVVLTLVLGACSDGDGPDADRATTTTNPPTTVATGSSADPGTSPDWAVYGHDDANSRLNPTENEITPESVSTLAPDWTIDGRVGVTGTPVVADGVAYFDDWTGAAHAVDAATGEQVWSTTLGGQFVAAPAVTEDAVFVAAGHSLHRLDRTTGEVDWTVDTDDHPYAQISASPVVVDDLVIQGTASFENMADLDDYTFRGSLGAYDVATGDEVWRFEATPDDETAGAGVGIWSTPAVDRERGLLYVGTGQTLEEPTAPNVDAIVAVDYRTGELEWVRQFTYPDVFSNGYPVGKDADVGASPNLWTSDGRDLVGAGDKGGTFHAVDRDTGEVVWDTELTAGSFLGGQIGSSAFVDGRLVGTSIVGDPETNSPTDATKVFALDPATGEIHWEREVPGKVFAPVSAVPGVAFVGSDSGEMLAFDVETGDTLWSHDAPGPVAAGPSIVDGRVLWGYGFVLFGPPGDGGVISFTVGPEPPPATGPTTATTASSGCADPDDLPAGITDHVLADDGGGVERPYQLVVPEDLDPSEPAPVVLGLHALSISHTFVPTLSGLDTMAERYGFIGVAPSGRLDGTTPFWHAAGSADNHDVAFVGELLDELETRYCVDPTRVFSLGMSNGAQMSSLLACRMPGRIRGIGPIAGAEYPGTCVEEPVPVMAFHGTADPIVTYEGGGLNAARIADLQHWKGDVPDDVPETLGVDDSMDRWAEHNGCDPEFAEERLTDEVRVRRWSGCEAPTVLYAIDGGGHAWPGKPQPAFEDQFGPGTTDVDASELIFSFFFEER